MGLLTGKTALITGAARGIGKAVAMKFASEGANIAFTDLVLNDDMAAGLEATRQGDRGPGRHLPRLCGQCRRLCRDRDRREADPRRLRQHRHPRQQCRNHQGRPDAPHVGGTMGCRPQRQPEVGLQLHPRLRSHHASPAWRIHHQHVERGGCPRQRWPVQLLGLQGRHDRSGQVYRPGARPPRACAPTVSPRLHRDSDDGPTLRGDPQGLDGQDSSSPWRTDRGYRQRLPLPRLRPLKLCQRPRSSRSMAA